MDRHPDGIHAALAKQAVALARQRQTDTLWREAAAKDTIAAYASFAWAVRGTGRVSEAAERIRRIIQDRGQPLGADDSHLLDALGKFLQSVGTEYAGDMLFQTVINEKLQAQAAFSGVVSLSKHGLLCFSDASFIAEGFSKRYGQVCRLVDRYFTIVP
jgi:hypothetical protein